MKKILLLAALLLGMVSLAHAQDGEDWSFPVKFSGQRPVISDFVSAILSQEEVGESLSYMSNQWDLYQKGEALPEGMSFLVDTKNGYLRFDEAFTDEDGTAYNSSIEFCYWNCSDGVHKLIGLNETDFRNGKPFMGQFSGLSFYLYDSKTRSMDAGSAYDLGLDYDFPEDTEVMVYHLPRTGKTVMCEFYAPSGHIIQRYTWNGSKFVQE